MAIYKPGSGRSPGTDLASTLILEFPAFQTVRNTFLLFKPLSLWYSGIAAQTEYDKNPPMGLVAAYDMYPFQHAPSVSLFSPSSITSSISSGISTFLSLFQAARSLPKAVSLLYPLEFYSWC